MERMHHIFELKNAFWKGQYAIALSSAFVHWRPDRAWSPQHLTLILRSFCKLAEGLSKTVGAHYFFTRFALTWLVQRFWKRPARRCAIWSCCKGVKLVLRQGQRLGYEQHALDCFTVVDDNREFCQDSEKMQSDTSFNDSGTRLACWQLPLAANDMFSQLPGCGVQKDWSFLLIDSRDLGYDRSFKKPLGLDCCSDSGYNSRKRACNRRSAAQAKSVRDTFARTEVPTIEIIQSSLSEFLLYLVWNLAWSLTRFASCCWNRVISVSVWMP